MQVKKSPLPKQGGNGLRALSGPGVPDKTPLPQDLPSLGASRTPPELLEEFKLLPTQPEGEELVPFTYLPKKVSFLLEEEREESHDKELALLVISSSRGVGDYSLELTLQIGYRRQPVAGPVAVEGFEKSHDRGDATYSLYIP